MTEFFGEVIHRYTRAQALADGALIDVTTTAAEAGFRYPTALAHAAWEDCVAWAEEDNLRKGTCQDEAGRLWDVVWMALHAIRRTPDQQLVRFTVLRVPRAGQARRPRRAELVVHCGPGDQGEPVITIADPADL